MPPTASPLELQPSTETWTVEAFASDPSWITLLTPEHRAELHTALERVKGIAAGRSPRAWQPAPEDFPLPTLAPLLREAREQLESGYGARLLQGFPLDLPEEDCCLMYSGLLSHVGVMQPQTIRGEVLQPVQDEGQAKLDERRGSKHNLGLPIHNDGCDVVGFLCRRTPLSGGQTILVNVGAVHNDLLENHPEALVQLYGTFHNAWQDYMYPEGRNTEATALPRTWEAPIFSRANGRISMRYSRFYIDRAQHFPGVPSLKPEQKAALDLLDTYLGDDSRWQYRRDFAPGDVFLLNNHTVLHSRTEFVNGPEVENQRQLYRAWMSVSNSRALDGAMAVFFGDVTAGAPRRGGVLERFMQR